MVGRWPHRPFTFHALSKTYGQMWLRCDVCRRHARLKLAGLHDIDYRTKTFSCSVCGSEAYFCLIGPTNRDTITGSTKLRSRSVIRQLSGALLVCSDRALIIQVANCPGARWIDGASPCV